VEAVTPAPTAADRAPNTPANEVRPAVRPIIAFAGRGHPE